MSDPRLKRDAQKYRGVADVDSDFAEMQALWNTALEQAVAAHSQVDGEVNNENVGADRYSIETEPKSDTKFVKILISDIVGDGIAETDSLARKARLYLKKKFRGVVLPLGKTKSVYIRTEGINETTNPAKVLSDSDYRGKMLALTELDNLLKSSEYIGWEPDDGRHPDVKRWIKYRTYFLFLDEYKNSQVIRGVVRIKRINRGDCYYDITEIENITNGNLGQSIIEYAAQSISDVSDTIVNQKNSGVNRKYAQNTNNNTNSVDYGRNSFGDEDEQ